MPIESRYQGRGMTQHFRRSYFRPLTDLYRITAHVVGRVWRYGRIWSRYAQTHRSRPLIHDPGDGPSQGPGLA